ADAAALRAGADRGLAGWRRHRSPAGPDPDPGSHAGLRAEDRRDLRLAADLPAADGRADERVHAPHRSPHRQSLTALRGTWPMEHYATGQQVFAGGLVFARLAPILMLIPGIGETFVPARIRLSLALLL